MEKGAGQVGPTFGELIFQTTACSQAPISLRSGCCTVARVSHSLRLSGEFRTTQGKEDMKACTLLLTIALFALSSQAYARGQLCGDFARHNLVSSDPGSKYNLACNWRDWGRATSAQVGAMVIWCSGHHHHVGKIVGPCNGNMCLVRSGNDDGAIRTRVRSVAGAVFRI